ncbi:MAG: hydroxymethylglutaryl-CoA lyase [Bacteroidota bacterium]
MYPAVAELCEVGPRDGFQFEATPISSARKISTITRLAKAGLKRIQVTSFVHPKWVPQMADAEAVVEGLPSLEGVVYTGLALNQRGVARAAQTRLTHIDLSIATHPQHSRDNANMTVEEGVAQAEAMIEAAHGAGLRPQLGLQTVFGYAAPGDVPLAEIEALARRFATQDLESFSLADSTGMANPVMIRERVQAIQAILGDVPLVLHLHDTRGLGMANVVAALECGIARFDTSLGGLGGCPFIPGATGNIATEDTAYLLGQLGVETGIDLNAVAAVTRDTASFLDKPLPGKLYTLM